MRKRERERGREEREREKEEKRKGRGERERVGVLVSEEDIPAPQCQWNIKAPNFLQRDVGGCQVAFLIEEHITDQQNTDES